MCPGVLGLQIAAQLMDRNFTVRLFDRAPGPVGNWLYSEEHQVPEFYPYVLVFLLFLRLTTLQRFDLQRHTQEVISLEEEFLCPLFSKETRLVVH